MPKTTIDRRPVSVTVRIIDDSPPEGKFELISDLVKKGGRPGQEEELEFDNWQGGTYQEGFEVKFTIQDDTKKGYGFFQDSRHPDPNDALWVKIVNANGACPKNKRSWAGFVPTEVSPDRQVLTVDNPNKHKQYFGFAFLFSLPTQTEPGLMFDPVGDNRNGQALR